MIPVLFKIGPIPINSYGLLLVCGFMFAYWLISKEFKERGIPGDFASTEITLGMIGAIVGSRIFHVAEHLDEYNWENIGRLFKGSGFSWYGGFVLAAILILWAARRKGIRWYTLVDASAPAIAIGYGFGRVGCFLSGDGCYGQPCAELGLHLPAPLCMAFPKGAVPTTEIVLNTPIFEICGAAATFAYLMMARKWIRTPSVLFGQMVIIHAVMRFFIEFVRQNPKLALGLSQAQWVSIAGVGIGIGLILHAPHIRLPEPDPPKKKKQKNRN